MLLLFLLVVHQAGAVAALGELYAILVAQLVNLSHELLYLLHDGLVLLLILLLVGSLLLLLLLVAGREVRSLLLLRLLRLLVPRVGDVFTADGAATATLGLTCSLFQFPLKFFE